MLKDTIADPAQSAAEVPPLSRKALTLFHLRSIVIDFFTIVAGGLRRKVQFNEAVFNIRILTRQRCQYCSLRHEMRLGASFQ